MTYSWDGEDYMYVAKDTEITLPKEWPENLKIINIDHCKILNKGGLGISFYLPKLPSGLKTFIFSDSGLNDFFLTFPDGLEMLDISDNPGLELSFDFPNSLKYLYVQNNNWDIKKLLPLPPNLIDLKWRGNDFDDIKTMPIFPYTLKCIDYIPTIGHQSTFMRYNIDDIKVAAYNKIAEINDIATIDSIDDISEEDYNKIIAFDTRKEISRATDIGFLLISNGIPPLVAAEIASWDRNRIADTPTISAFDVAQINGLMENLQQTMNYVKRKPTLHKLQSKAQQSKK
uniref:Leucine-rich repeat domain-containing protein n=1 Tax=viral metagenome TaxID=1070528 RepID=A0A6C0JRE2_9ZZZZ